MNHDPWFEYDCPNSLIDFDVCPPPKLGESIYCSGCGKEHLVTRELGTWYAYDEDGNMIEVDPM